MLNLTREAYRERARASTVVPVRRTLLADQVTPVAVFGRLCGDGPGFLLESVDHGGRWSRWSFVGRNPRARITAANGQLTVEGRLPIALPDDTGILDAVESLLAVCSSEPEEDLPLHSGLVGYLGYDVVREVERLPDVPLDDRGWPDAVLSVIGELVAIDHWSQRAHLIANTFVPTLIGDVEADDAVTHCGQAFGGLLADTAVCAGNDGDLLGHDGNPPLAPSRWLSGRP